MMLFVWICVMSSAFFPGGAHLSAFATTSYEEQLRAELEAPQPIASSVIGAAQHVTRYASFAR